MSNTKYTSVLVVEDNQVFRNNLAESLSANHNVIEADSGMAALEILKSSIPDLIILDIMLPFPLDGLAVLRIIKNEAKLALIPVILISGIKTEQTILDGLQMGANDYMVKPFRMGELMLKSNNLVNIRQKMQQIIEREIVFKNHGELKTDAEQSFKKKFESIVESYVSDAEISVPKIASQMSMSVSTLERWSKKIYGVKPKQFMLNARLAKAEIYLRHKLGSVNDVAYMLGYSSPSYFCLTFKKKFGVSPKSYMRFPAQHAGNETVNTLMDLTSADFLQ